MPGNYRSDGMRFRFLIGSPPRLQVECVAPRSSSRPRTFREADDRVTTEFEFEDPYAWCNTPAGHVIIDGILLAAN